MAPISVTLVTGPMRDTMPSAVVGSSVCWPKAVLLGCTVSRLPSRPSSSSSPDLEDWEMPSTPTMAAMPMLMPSADSRCPHPPAAQAQAAHPEQVPAGQPGARPRPRRSHVGRVGRVTADPPVADLDAAVHGGGHVQVVGDDHDGGALLVELAEQVQDGRPGGRVQVAGGLVGHDQGGPAGQGPGDGGALLLAAGELVGPVAEPVAEADPLDGGAGQPAPVGHPAAPVEQAVGHVVEHAEPVEQEELLEHEPQPPGPQPRQLLVGHGRGVLPGDAHHAPGGPLQGAHDVQQGALARPRRADDGHQLARLDAQADPGQGHHRRVAGVLLDHVDQLQDRAPTAAGLLRPGPRAARVTRRAPRPGCRR